MDSSSLVFTICLSMLAILILISTFNVFVAVYKNRSLQTRGNTLLLSLAASDLLVSLFNIPLAAVSSSAILFRKTGSSLCDWSGFFEMVFLIASVLSVVAINVNRYVLLVHWNKYFEVFSIKRVICTVFMIWFCAVALSAPPLLGISEISYKEGKSHCFVDWRVTPVYTFSLMIVCFFLPLVFMTFCYYGIYQFRKQNKQLLKELELKQKAKFANNRRLKKSNPADHVIPEKLGNHSWNAISPLPNKDNDGFDDAENSDTSKQNVARDSVDMQMYSSFITKNLSRRLTYPFASETSAMRIENYSSNDNTTEKGALNVELSMETRVFLKSRSLPDIFQIHGSGVIPRDTDCSPYVLTPPSDHRLFNAQQTKGLVSTYLKSISFDQWRIGKRKKRRRRIGRREDRKLTLMCFAIVSAFFICWFPFVVTMLIEVLSSIRIPVWMDRVALLFGYFNSLLNPIIYIYYNRNFQKQLRKMYCKI